jgi:quercetin dioxygenase-like cupin family protein
MLSGPAQRSQSRLAMRCIAEADVRNWQKRLPPHATWLYADAVTIHGAYLHMQSTIRSIVTGHDAAAKAIVKTDDVLSGHMVDGGVAAFIKVWTTNTSPADNNDESDGSLRESGLTCPGGTVLRIVDFAPGCKSPMHRTQSIDYGIVLEGEMTMELDGGSVAHLKAGDVVVQRGTNHLWQNISDKPCRMAFVLIEAKPVEAGGARLEQNYD